MLEIADSGANIHLARKSTPTMASVIILYGSTMESTRIATFQIPGLSKQSRQIHSFPRMQTAPLISLVILCYDECTITLDKQ